MTSPYDRQITVRGEVYDHLLELLAPGESFNDLMHRVVLDPAFGVPVPTPMPKPSNSTTAIVTLKTIRERTRKVALEYSGQPLEFLLEQACTLADEGKFLISDTEDEHTEWAAVEIK